MEERSPSAAQGSVLAEEALQVAKDQLIEMDQHQNHSIEVGRGFDQHDHSDHHHFDHHHAIENQIDQQLKLDHDHLIDHVDHIDQRQMSLDENTSPKKVRQHSSSIAPLQLSSLDLDEAAPMPPLATPELRRQHHSRRDTILAFTDDELSGMSQEDFEDYFQYLTPGEIFDLEERRRKFRQQHRHDHHVGSMEGIATDTGAESVVESERDGSMFGGSAWEARDYVLHLR